jgi:hypothetical protein
MHAGLFLSTRRCLAGLLQLADFRSENEIAFSKPVDLVGQVVISAFPHDRRATKALLLFLPFTIVGAVVSDPS